MDRQHGGYGMVDNLYMTYEGNLLTSVRDDASRQSYAGATDFDGVRGQEYPLAYNDAGSLVSDAGRGIARINYDQLNNPVRIQFTNGNVTKYVYSATGEKLRVTYQTAVPNISVAMGSSRELAPSEIQFADSTDYLLGGVLTLKNGRIDKYQFDEGYCQAARVGNTCQDNFTFYYYNRDHLGNVRQVAKATRSKNGTIVQTMDYYPFGAQLCDGSADSNVQSRRYNGKELDLMHGLNTHDYGARQYDPILARWDRMDPLCEKYYSISPYAYCGNNPVMYIDPDGMKFDLSNMTESQLKQYNNDINMLLNDCSSFSQLYEELEKSENIITISLGSPTAIGNGEEIDGHFIANDAGGGEIVFSKTKLMNGVIPKTAYVEEFFHAYQHENAGLYNGLFNYEFEAKVFATVVGLESGLGYGRYVGMVDYQDRILANKYGNTLQPISPQVVNTIQFQQDYIKRANSYAKYNREHKVGDPHYRCTTKGLPYSLMKIINSAYSK